MTAICDNKSVGVIIRNEAGGILLIERKKFPYGFAAPAGHVDDFPTPEACAHVEVEEEVGLKVVKLNLVHEADMNNPCRREGGSHHHWWVYEAQVTGSLKASAEETKQAGWYSLEQIALLATKTAAYESGDVSETEWESSPGLEPIWRDFFSQLNIISIL